MTYRTRPRRLEAHWRQGTTKKTTYARLDLWWMPIVDREVLRSEAEDPNSTWHGSVLGSRLHGQMQSPLALSDSQALWLLEGLTGNFRRELDRRIFDVTAR